MRAKPWLAVALGGAVLAACSSSSPAENHPSTTEAVAATYPYTIPVDTSSPWPEMRHDALNSGESPIAARYYGDKPWSYATGNSIFSTPVIGGDGTVYVGSADDYFYAVSRSGKLEWRFKTGNVIDSAASVGRGGTAGSSVVTFGSGDGYLYQLRTAPTNLSPDRRVLWRYKAPRSQSAGQQVSWWEGNVELTHDGTLLAGNTGGAAFALHPNGTLAWEHRTGNAVWTEAAVGPDGTSYWGSLAGSIFALGANGHLQWSVATLGFVVASPALASNGTLYGASFDGKVYAIDSKTGKVEWTFQTADNIYGSPALVKDSAGRTTAVVVASTDGSVYAINPSGHLLWRYDTGDVIRSSPAIGGAPAGESAGHIVYVGSDDGRLYALDAATGQRRWSFDTTSSEPALRDRNDLNSSPALGVSGVYIGSEDGSLWYVPYDYCLHRRDPRCDVSPGATFAPNVTATYLVTPGGSTETATTLTVAPESVMPFRLVVRRNGVTVDAAFEAGDPPSVTISPPVPFSMSLSGDGHFVFVDPLGFLAPNTRYTVTIAGTYQVASTPLGDGSTGNVRTTFRLSTPPSSTRALPLRISPQHVSALNLTRLAIPLPSFLTSVNTIGFDSYDWIVSTLSVSPPDADGDGHLLMFVVGAMGRAGGPLVADPSTAFAFPLEGSYHDGLVSVSASNVTLPFSFGPVPMQELMFRMQLGSDLVATPGSSLYGVLHCADVPYYGTLLETVTNLCNNSGDLVASGTFLVSGYQSSGGASSAPKGLSVSSLDLRRPGRGTPGSVVATFALASGTHYPAGAHVLSIVLTNAATGALVPLAYKAATTTTAGSGGDVESTTLQIPAGVALPAEVRVTVVADAFPLAARNF